MATRPSLRKSLISMAYGLLELFLGFLTARTYPIAGAYFQFYERSSGYFFNLYPVLNIHQTVTRQAPRKSSVMPILTPWLTSAISKKLQRNPLTKYTTGLNSEMVCQAGGNTLVE